MAEKRSSPPSPISSRSPSSSSPALVVGHCCHDSITTASGSCFEALGGSAAYISNIFDALGIPLRLVSKVGPDFAYFDLLPQHPPMLASSSSTTHFYADFSLGEERILRTGPICEPILPSDIPLPWLTHDGRDDGGIIRKNGGVSGTTSQPATCESDASAHGHDGAGDASIVGKNGGYSRATWPTCSSDASVLGHDGNDIIDDIVEAGKVCPIESRSLLDILLHNDGGDGYGHDDGRDAHDDGHEVHDDGHDGHRVLGDGLEVHDTGHGGDDGLEARDNGHDKHRVLGDELKAHDNRRGGHRILGDGLEVQDTGHGGDDGLESRDNEHDEDDGLEAHDSRQDGHRVLGDGHDGRNDGHDGLEALHDNGHDGVEACDNGHDGLEAHDNGRDDGGRDDGQEVHDGGISIAAQESGSCSSMESGVYDVGLAVGIVGEISVETLGKMAEVCKQLVVDVQALIRTVDPNTGLVGLVKLENTPFDALLHRISFLKAAYNESLFIDIARARERTSIIVTRGKLGCTVYCKEAEFSIPAFQACEVDPTGAGDSFLAGFSAGLYHGFSVRDAALIGNYFGALAVAQVGLPTFSHLDIQNIHAIVNEQRIVSKDHQMASQSNEEDRQLPRDVLSR